MKRASVLRKMHQRESYLTERSIHPRVIPIAIFQLAILNNRDIFSVACVLTLLKKCFTTKKYFNKYLSHCLNSTYLPTIICLIKFESQNDLFSDF